MYDQLTGPPQVFLQLLQVSCWVFFHLVGLVPSQQSLVKQLKGTTSVEECVTSDSESEHGKAGTLKVLLRLCCRRKSC